MSMTKIMQEPGTVLFPVPAVLVSCGEGSSANVITLAWVGTLCSEPPLIGIGVRPSRHSHGLIKKYGEFVVNIPRADQVRWVDHCGTVSGRDEDKWATCGFSRTPASELQVPLIAECPVNIECELRETISLGTHSLFIGEVVAVHVEGDILDDNGRLDAVRAEPFAYLNGAYHRIGDLIGTFGFSKR